MSNVVGSPESRASAQLSTPSGTAAATYLHRGESSRPSGASRNNRASMPIANWPPTSDETSPRTEPSAAGPGPSSLTTQML